MFTYDLTGLELLFSVRNPITEVAPEFIVLSLRLGHRIWYGLCADLLRDIISVDI